MIEHGYANQDPRTPQDGKRGFTWASSSRRVLSQSLNGICGVPGDIFGCHSRGCGAQVLLASSGAGSGMLLSSYSECIGHPPPRSSDRVIQPQMSIAKTGKPWLQEKERCNPLLMSVTGTEKGGGDAHTV